MAQLIVRNIEDKVVRKLKERAAKYGVSMEEVHRRILREHLLKEKKPKMTFGEFLIAPPYWDDEMVKAVNNRKRDKPRDIQFE